VIIVCDTSDLQGRVNQAIPLLFCELAKMMRSPRDQAISSQQRAIIVCDISDLQGRVNLAIPPPVLRARKTDGSPLRSGSLRPAAGDYRM